MTGSLASMKPASIQQGQTVAVWQGTADRDMEDIMEFYGKAIANIHGDTEFGAQEPGAFSQPIVPRVSRDPGQTIGEWSLGLGSSLSDSLETDGFAVDSTNAQTATNSTNKVRIASPGITVSGVLGDLIAFEKSDGTKKVYAFTGTVSSGNTEINVAYRPYLSSIDGDLAQGDISAIRFYDVSVAGNLIDKEWNDAVVRQIVSKTDLRLGSGRDGSPQDVMVEATNKVHLVSPSSAVGMLVDLQNAAGAMALQMGGVEKARIDQNRMQHASELKVTSDAGVVHIGSADPLLITHDAAFPSVKSTTALHMSASNCLILEGRESSGGISFRDAALTGFGFGGNSGGGLVVAHAANEGSNYIAAFGGNDTSIVKALTDLKNGQVGLEASEFLLSGSAVSAGGNVDLYQRPTGGTATDLRQAGFQDLDVFVNGQRLVSQSASNDGDYTVLDTASNRISLTFDLLATDIVQVIDRS